MVSKARIGLWKDRWTYDNQNCTHNRKEAVEKIALVYFAPTDQ